MSFTDQYYRGRLFFAAMLLTWLGPAAAAMGQVPGPSPAAHPDRQASLVTPLILPVAGPLNDPAAEISGLTWKDDWLVALPQDPIRFGRDGMLGFFAIPRQQILDALDGRRSRPLEPSTVDCEAAGMMRMIAGFDGLEAMGIMGDRVYMTIEAKEDTVMAGYLVCGHYGMVGEKAVIDMTRLTSIPLGCNIPNVAEESMIIDGRRVITFSEANGLNVAPRPRAKVFDEMVNYLGSIPFPQIEYRVTDATDLDEHKRFWVINYFYPPERAKLRPAPDPEISHFGAPEGFDPEGCIERLLELQLTDDDRIVRTETPPIYLEIEPGEGCRNWEAVVRLDGRGFLLMTDKYPGTLLAFVPDPFATGKDDR
jgi:hypothetical protein